MTTDNYFEGSGEYLSTFVDYDYTGKFYVITDHGMTISDEHSIKQVAEANKTRYYKWGEIPGHFEKGIWILDYPNLQFNFTV